MTYNLLLEHIYLYTFKTTYLIILKVILINF